MSHLRGVECLGLDRIDALSRTGSFLYLLQERAKMSIYPLFELARSFVSVSLLQSAVMLILVYFTSGVFSMAGGYLFLYDQGFDLLFRDFFVYGGSLWSTIWSFFSIYFSFFKK